MAKIINEDCKRRIIRLSTDDVINIVREYQATTAGLRKYSDIREALGERELYIPEEMF